MHSKTESDFPSDPFHFCLLCFALLLPGGGGVRQIVDAVQQPSIGVDVLRRVRVERPRGAADRLQEVHKATRTGFGRT